MPKEVHSKLSVSRIRNGQQVLHLTRVRKFLKGKSYDRGKVETRGRKRSWTRANVLNANRARLAKIAKVKGEKYVTWGAVVKGSRAPKVHRTTAAKSFLREKLPVKWRRDREKPPRTKEHEKEREDVCGAMGKWPLKKFTDGLHLIMDNKMWPVPTTADARSLIQKQKVRGQLRLPSEGLQKNMTKPNKKKHRSNPGGVAQVCAGISGGRIALWEYFDGRWNGQKAADLYRGPIKTLLKRKFGNKKRYVIAEDNDPTGYKSNKAIAAKKECGICPIHWPRYSPDMMPLDFSLWTDIEERMVECAPKGRESVEAYKVRLRRVAMRTPPATVLKAVKAMRQRARDIAEAKGGDIARD